MTDTPSIDGLGRLARECLATAHANGGLVTLSAGVLSRLLSDQRQIAIQGERTKMEKELQAAIKQERERCEAMKAFDLEAHREGYMRLWRAYERADHGSAMYFLPGSSPLQRMHEIDLKIGEEP